MSKGLSLENDSFDICGLLLTSEIFHLSKIKTKKDSFSFLVSILEVIFLWKQLEVKLIVNLKLSLFRFLIFCCYLLFGLPYLYFESTRDKQNN